MNTKTLVKALAILQKECPTWKVPIVTQIAERSNDPFKVLISTLLSLRTKDEVTSKASRLLFREADTPETIIRLSASTIQKLIYPVGFYKRKAENMLKVCRILLDDYNSLVPDTLEELLALPGVGRKTANLVLTLGFGKPGICVDTHVHRISNRLGYVNTKTPEQTEMSLREKLPGEWWIPINDIIVAFGQALCKPVSPWCSKCPVAHLCQKKGVERSR
jgi:endonuclease-3